MKTPTPNSTPEVTLHWEDPLPVEASLNGLALWTVLNQHDVERDESMAITVGEDSKSVQRVKFEFDQVIDWQTWREVCVPRLKYARKMEIRPLPELIPHTGKMAIVGAGPSVKDYLPEIAKFKESEFDNLMSINATHDWLIRNNIIPRIHVISEFDLEDVTDALGGDPHKDVVYYIASYCNQNIFKQLDSYRKVLFHGFMPMQGYQEAIKRYFPGEFMVTCAFSTFFKSLAIATVLGFRHFDLFGIDSSFEDLSHLPGYKISNIEPPITVWGADTYGKNARKFTTGSTLMFQAREFLEFCKCNQQGIRLRFHGDGLLPHLHKVRYPEQYR